MRDVFRQSQRFSGEKCGKGKRKIWGYVMLIVLIPSEINIKVVSLA